MSISERRLKIADYFDKLINAIDLKSETAMLTHGQNETLINARRMELIAKIKQVQEFNLKNLSSSDKPFLKYSFIVDKVGSRDKINEPFGFLITLDDFFMTDEQLKFYTEFTEFFNTEKAFSVNTASFFFHQPLFNSLQKSRRVSMSVRSSFYSTQNFTIQTNRSEFLKIQELKLKNVIINAFNSNTLFLFRDNIEKLELKYDLIESTISLEDIFNTILIFQNDYNVTNIELTLNLTDLSIHNLSRMSDLNVTTFQLHTSKLIISQSSFAGFENLAELVLSNNKIERFEPTPFVRLEKLKKLSLNKSIIETIKTNFFKGLNGLEELTLWGCKISCLESDAFLGLSKLKVLNLNDNRLVILDREAFNGLESIQELLLSTNRIKEIDMSVFSTMKDLKRLNLSKNNLTDFQISKSKLNLKHLEELSLSYNSIKSFKFENMSSLKKLNLSNNQIERIECGTLAGLSKLEALYFSFNKIKYIENEALVGLSGLKLLDLYSNSITSINKRSFGSLVSLRTLSMGNNTIGYVHPEAFDDLRELSDFNANIVENALEKYAATCKSNSVLLSIKF
jgi:Leucine-rich repeat (LRR) protein